MNIYRGELHSIKKSVCLNKINMPTGKTTDLKVMYVLITGVEKGFLSDQHSSNF